MVRLSETMAGELVFFIDAVYSKVEHKSKAFVGQGKVVKVIPLPVKEVSYFSHGCRKRYGMGHILRPAGYFEWDNHLLGHMNPRFIYINIIGWESCVP